VNLSGPGNDGRPTAAWRWAAHAELLRRTELALAVLAVVVGVVIGTLAAVTTAPGSDDPRLAGMFAGIGTVGCCWALLILAGTLWRRRLAASFAATDRAHIKPPWSTRRGY
jgi:energy-converting hydrogenase Eha subunit E